MCTIHYSHRSFQKVQGPKGAEKAQRASAEFSVRYNLAVARLGLEVSGQTHAWTPILPSKPRTARCRCLFRDSLIFWGHFGKENKRKQWQIIVSQISQRMWFVKQWSQPLILHLSFNQTWTDVLWIPGKGELVFPGIPQRGSETNKQNNSIQGKKKPQTAYRTMTYTFS